MYTDFNDDKYIIFLYPNNKSQAHTCLWTNPVDVYAYRGGGSQNNSIPP